MSEATDLLRGGDPRAALEVLQEEVRTKPADAEFRVFLFQLYSILGSWDRALTQLNIAGELDSGTLGMVMVYRQALSCEAVRADVFAGKQTPLVFGHPERWVALQLEALRVEVLGEVGQAAELRGEAFDLAPVSTGQLNGQPFQWLADADMRLGPLLEVIINGQYYWVPVQRIAEVKIDEPEDLRDLVWLPAQFKWTNGGDAVGLIPARYPGSETSEDPLLCMGRRTEWLDQGEDTYHGIGQRVLATDLEEYSLLDIRGIVVEPTVDG